MTNPQTDERPNEERVCDRCKHLGNIRIGETQGDCTEHHKWVKLTDTCDSFTPKQNGEQEK